MSTQDILKTLKKTVDVDTDGLIDDELLQAVIDEIYRIERDTVNTSRPLVRKLIQFAINRWIRKFFLRTR